MAQVMIQMNTESKRDVGHGFTVALSLFRQVYPEAEVIVNIKDIPEPEEEKKEEE